MVFGKKEDKKDEAVPAAEPVEAAEVEVKVEEPVEAELEKRSLSPSEKKREAWAMANAANEKERKRLWYGKQYRLGRMNEKEYKEAVAALKGK